MRSVPLLLALLALTTAAEPRRDRHGDPLPEGAVARLGTTRFLPPDFVRRAALAPGGGLVVTTSDGTDRTHLDFFDTATGQHLRRLGLKDMQASQPRFTPDGKHLTFADWTGIHVLDATSGAVVRTIKHERLRDQLVAASPDGTLLAVQPDQYLANVPVLLWDAKSGKEVASLPGRGAMCKGLTFGQDGKRLLLASLVPSSVTETSRGFDQTSRLALACVDLTTRKVSGETTAGSGHTFALAGDGETVAFEADDHQSVRVRHLPSGAEPCTLPLKHARFAFTPDSKSLVTFDDTGRGAIWDAVKGTKVRDLAGSLTNKEYEIIGIAQDGRTLAVLDGGWHSAPLIVVWNLTTGERVSRPPGHAGTITGIAYSPDGKLLASGSIDRTVRLWNPDTGEQVRVLTTHADAVSTLTFSADGKLLASASKTGTVHLSAVADGKLAAALAGPVKGATALAFAADGKTLYAGSNDAEVFAWDIASKKEVARHKTAEAGVVMAFTPGGTVALTGRSSHGWDDTPAELRLWDMARQRSGPPLPLEERKGGGVRCEAAVFAPQGRLFALSQVSEYQGIRPSYGAAQLRVWERATGQPVRTLAPTVTKLLAFAPSGRYLASGGTGRSGHLSVGYGSGVVIWDILTGEKVTELKGSPEVVAFSPDGTRLATAGRDHTVVIYEFAPKPVAVPRPFDPATVWNDLGKDAPTAYATIGQLVAAGDPAVALLKAHLRPVPVSDPATVANLIADLDSEAFNEREAAQQALEQLGEGIGAQLAKALQGKVGPEARRRLEEVLSHHDETATVHVRNGRALAALEWLASPAARALLRTLAAGAPGARLTSESRATLGRLAE